jgi:hypothetical protein
MLIAETAVSSARLPLSPIRCNVPIELHIYADLRTLFSGIYFIVLHRQALATSDGDTKISLKLKGKKALEPNSFVSL